MTEPQPSQNIYDQQREQIARMMEQNSHIIEQTSQNLAELEAAQEQLRDAYRYVTGRQIVETKLATLPQHKSE